MKIKTSGLRRLYLVLAVLLICQTSELNGEKRPEYFPEDTQVDGLAAAAEFITSSMDWSIDPCDDFYKYKCGKMGEIAKQKAPNASSFDHWDVMATNFTRKIVRLLDTMNPEETLMPHVYANVKQFYDKCMHRLDTKKQAQSVSDAWEFISDLGGSPMLDENWSMSETSIISMAFEVQIRFGVQFGLLLVPEEDLSVGANVVYLLFSKSSGDGTETKELIEQFASYAGKTLVDLANRKRQEKAMLELEEEFNSIFEQSEKKGTDLRSINLGDIRKIDNSTADALVKHFNFTRETFIMAPEFMIERLKLMAPLWGKYSRHHGALQNFLIGSYLAKVKDILGIEFREEVQTTTESVDAVLSRIQEALQHLGDLDSFLAAANTTSAEMEQTTLSAEMEQTTLSAEMEQTTLTAEMEQTTLSAEMEQTTLTAEIMSRAKRSNPEAGQHPTLHNWNRNAHGFIGKLIQEIPEDKAYCLEKMVTEDDTGFFRNAMVRLTVDTYGPSRDEALRVRNLVDLVTEQLRRIIMSAPWLDFTSKVKAMNKLTSIIPRIAHPLWIVNDTAFEAHYANIGDISSSDSYFTAYGKAHFNKIVNMIQKTMRPIAHDSNDFDMSPFVTNAWYQRDRNALALTLALLQPPFYRPDYPPAVIYGIIGAIIGHELSHGFDPEGVHFSLNGDDEMWMSDSSMKSFKQNVECIIDQYSNFCYNLKDYSSSEDSSGIIFDRQRREANTSNDAMETTTSGYNETTPEPDNWICVDGRKTASENIADLIGLKAAHKAFEVFMTENSDNLPRGVNIPGLESYTWSHVFFMSFGSAWCTAYNDEWALGSTLWLDVHSPGPSRVNGTLQNSESFARVFGCPVNSTMNPEEKCKLWSQFG